MCAPLAVLAVMAVASAALQVKGQSDARKMAVSQENHKRMAQEQAILENRSRATKDFIRQSRLENMQSRQETIAMREEGQDVRNQALAASGTAVASAAERGVAGRSLDMILSDYEFQQNKEIGRMRMNQTMKDQQHAENIGGFQDQFEYRVSAMQPYVPRPQAPVDYFGPIFGAVSTVAGGAMAAGYGKPGPSTPSTNLSTTGPNPTINQAPDNFNA